MRTGTRLRRDSANSIPPLCALHQFAQIARPLGAVLLAFKCQQPRTQPPASIRIPLALILSLHNSCSAWVRFCCPSNGNSPAPSRCHSSATISPNNSNCANCAKTMRRQTQRARAARAPRSATHLQGALSAPTRCVKSGVWSSFRPPSVFVGYRCNSLPR